MIRLLLAVILVFALAGCSPVAPLVCVQPPTAAFQYTPAMQGRHSVTVVFEVADRCPVPGDFFQPITSTTAFACIDSQFYAPGKAAADLGSHIVRWAIGAPQPKGHAAQIARTK